MHRTPRKSPPGNRRSKVCRTVGRCPLAAPSPRTACCCDRRKTWARYWLLLVRALAVSVLRLVFRIRNRPIGVRLRRLHARRRVVPQIECALLAATCDAGTQGHRKEEEAHKIQHVSTMDAPDFEARAARVLSQIEQALEASAVDVDVESKEGGILELEFADRSKMIINRHGVAKEIWVAARSGGFHFRWDGAHWRDTRDGSELFSSLSLLVASQAGQDVSLRP